MNGLSGLFAAWQLFLRKPGAISGLDNKVDTAKFSFRAAFNAFPFYWLMVGGTRSGGEYTRPHSVGSDPRRFLFSDLDDVAARHVAPLAAGQQTRSLLPLSRRL